jgi:hypothetical protein
MVAPEGERLCRWFGVARGQEQGLIDQFNNNVADKNSEPSGSLFFVVILLTFFYRYILLIVLTDIVCGRTNDLVIETLLDNVRRPSCGTSNHK